MYISILNSVAENNEAYNSHYDDVAVGVDVQVRRWKQTMRNDAPNKNKWNN